MKAYALLLRYYATLARLGATLEATPPLIPRLRLSVYVR